MQLAAFTPFFRNHNIRGAIPQEPYRWDSVAHASRTAIATRYALLPYWARPFLFATHDHSWLLTPGRLVHALRKRFPVRNTARTRALFRIPTRAGAALDRPPVHGRTRHIGHSGSNAKRDIRFR
jgi:hypothetical protein